MGAEQGIEAKLFSVHFSMFNVHLPEPMHNGEAGILPPQKVTKISGGE
jgi:hypothetical protein